MKKSNFLKFLKFQHNSSCFELLQSILEPVVQKLVNVNKQRNVKKNCLFTFFEDKSRFFSLSAQTLSNEAKMGKIHREMPKIVNCDM